MSGFIRGANGGLLLGGAGGLRSTAVAAASGTIQTFTLTNTEGAATSTGFKRIPLGFIKADVPSSRVPQINIQGGGEITDVQYDERATWSDGSLKFCVASVRLATFTAAQTITYDVSSKSGSYDNTKTFDWTDVTANSDIQIILTDLKNKTRDRGRTSGGDGLVNAFSTTDTSKTVSVEHTSHGVSVGEILVFSSTDAVGGIDPDGTWSCDAVTDSDNYTFQHTSAATSTVANGGGSSNFTYEYGPSDSNADIGSGSYEAVANDIVATRLTKRYSGPITDGWDGWIMFKDQTGGAEETFLQARFFINIWNDGSGTVQDNIEFGAIAGQYWYDVGQPDLKSYSAELFDDVSSIHDYGAVNHPAHSGFVLNRMDADDQHMDRHWLNANMSTLHYKYDRDNLVASGLMPPLDTSLSPTESGVTTTYVPFSDLGFASDFGEKEGNARGGVTGFGAQSFMLQTTSTAIRDKIHAFTTFHASTTFRSNKTRDRSSVTIDDYNDFSGESSDVSNTIWPFIMDPLDAGDYDFTADGLPAAEHAYRSSGNAGYANGYVDAWGGFGDYITGIDDAGRDHGTNFAHTAYLHSGDRMLYEAVISNATGCMHSSNAVGNGVHNLGNYSFADRRSEWSIASTLYTGVWLARRSNYRHNGWVGASFSLAWGVCPDNDEMKNYFDTQLAHHGDFWTTSIANYPQAYIDSGLVFNGNQQQTPFDHFCTIGYYMLYRATEDAGIKAVADMQGNFQFNLWNAGSYMINSYRNLCFDENIDTNDSWASNPANDPSTWLIGYNDGGEPLTAADDIITKQSSWNDGWVDGTACRFWEKKPGGSNATVPPEVDISTEYETINGNANTDTQVSDDGGSTAIDFASDATVSLWLRFANDDKAVVGDDGWAVPGSLNTNIGHGQAALYLAFWGGHPDITQTDIDNLTTFIAPIDRTDNDKSQWALEG